MSIFIPSITTLLGGSKISGVSSASKYGGYRPPQWGGLNLNWGSQLALVKSHIGSFFADAVFSSDVQETLQITSHPVQSGANLSDHAFVQPAHVSMELGVSDSMAYNQLDSYGCFGSRSKSRAAIQCLRNLQQSRQPLSVVTAGGENYENMLIQSLSWHDDASTIYSVRIQVELVEIIVAAVATEKASARQWTSGGAAKKGEIQPEERGSLISEGLGDGERGLKNK